MEAEKLREAWWSAPKSPPSLESEEWIEKSYQDPLPFWRSLVALQAKMSPSPSKSELGNKYDFYYDCVLCHIESNQAIVVIDENGFMQSWTYKKVHRIVNFQVKQWSKNETKPGQLAIIILPVGIHFFIALLTALRLGLTICCLFPETPYLSEQHLSSLVNQLQPAWLVAQNKALGPSLDAYAKLTIEGLGEEDQLYDPSSYAYEATQVMQLSLALHRQNPFSMVPLDAQTTYLHALRDGLITLNLQPTTTWASTFSCPLRAQPCSTLMTFLSGATLLHVEEKAIENDPSLLKNEKLHLLGFSSPLQKFLSKHPITIGKQVKGYYKSPVSHHSSSWKAFVQVNKLEEIPAFHLFMDNSYGGSLFFSKPSLQDLTVFLKPSIALSWLLKDLNGSGEPSLTGMGCFSPVPSSKENDQFLTNLIVAQIESNVLISSTVKPCKEGVTIPLEKIEESISKLPFVESCMLHCIPKMGEIASYQVFLLVFIHPLKNNIPEKTKEEWMQTIHHQITEEIGAAFLPDRIEFYPLMPPIKKGRIDRDQCAYQFSNGQFNKKRNSQVYQLMSILKKFAQEALQNKV